MDGIFFGFLLLTVIVGTVVGWAIGNAKGRGPLGALLGFLLNWVGWIIMAVLAPSAEAQAKRDQQLATAIATATGGGPASGGRACPFCAELVQRDAIKCKHCGELLTTSEALRLVDEADAAAAAAAAEREAERNAQLAEIARLREERLHQEEQHRLAEEARVNALPAWRRWIVRYPAAAITVLLVVVGGLLLGGVRIAGTIAEAREAAAKEQARADARASREKAAAQREEVAAQEAARLDAALKSCDPEVVTELSADEIPVVALDNCVGLPDWWLKREVLGAGPETVDRLLASSSPLLRRAVALYADAEDPAIRVLAADPEALVRASAVERLSFTDTADVELLQEAAQDPSEDVRSALLRAVLRAGFDPENITDARPAIREMVRDACASYKTGESGYCDEMRQALS